MAASDEELAELRRICDNPATLTGATLRYARIRNALPALLDTIDELKAEVAKLRVQLAEQETPE